MFVVGYEQAVVLAVARQPQQPFQHGQEQQGHGQGNGFEQPEPPGRKE
jgi:hypothetical protein